MGKKEEEPNYKNQIKQRANKSGGLRQQAFEAEDKHKTKE
jgi:hypothetical protein